MDSDQKLIVTLTIAQDEGRREVRATVEYPATMTSDEAIAECLTLVQAAAHDMRHQRLIARKFDHPTITPSCRRCQAQVVFTTGGKS